MVASGCSYGVGVAGPGKRVQLEPMIFSASVALAVFWWALRTSTCWVSIVFPLSRLKA